MDCLHHLDQMECVKKYLAKLRKEYFILPQQADIFETEANLKDMEERLENIEVRLKTF